jgi:hypothetical protein
VNSWIFVNNLGDESQPFSDKKEPMEERDFSQTSIGAVRAKTNYHHVASYRIFDRELEQIGDDYYRK